MAVQFKSVIDAGDTATGNNLFLSTGINDGRRVNEDAKNSTEYEVAHFIGRLDSSGAATVTSDHTGTAPTVAPILKIASMRIWLGIPENIELPPIAGAASLIVGSPSTETTTNLTDITHPINTSVNKTEGFEVFDVTADIPMYATGASDNSTWVGEKAGSTVTITPV